MHSRQGRDLQEHRFLRLPLAGAKLSGVEGRASSDPQPSAHVYGSASLLLATAACLGLAFLPTEPAGPTPSGRIALVQTGCWAESQTLVCVSAVVETARLA